MTNQQAFVSTHSEDINRGLLEVCPERIRVIFKGFTRCKVHAFYRVYRLALGIEILLNNKYCVLERRKHLKSEAESILKEYEKIEEEIQRLNLERKEERLSNRVIDELYRKLEDRETYQNTELLLLPIFDAMPIRIPFLNSIALLSYSLIRQLSYKRKKRKKRQVQRT